MIQTVVTWSLALILGFVMFLVLRELVCYAKLKYYSSQGIPTSYYPLAGFFWLLTMEKGSKDQLTKLKRKIAENKSQKCFATNISMYTEPNLVLLDDDLIREFFNKEFDNTIKFLHIENINRGFSLLNGEEALNARSIYSKFFNHVNLVNIAGRIDKTIGRALDEFEAAKFTGQSLEVHSKELVTKAMCYLINCVVLGEDEKTFDASSDLSEFIVNYNFNMYSHGNSLANILTLGYLHRYNLFPESKRLWNQLKWLENTIYDRYLKRKEGQPQPDPNIIDCLVERNKELREAGSPEIDKSQIAGHWFLFQLAGIDTTMHLVVYALQLLAVREDLQNTLRSAIDNIVKSKNGQPMSYEDFSENEVLENFSNELLRVGSPAAVLNLRRAMKDFTIGDIRVRKGTSILVPVGVNMNSDRFYKDPDTFDINRLNKSALKETKKAGFMPFGMGRRTCPGRSVGEMMLKILLVKILSRYTIKPSSSSDDSKVFAIVYGYRNPKVVLEKRDKRVEASH